MDLFSDTRKGTSMGEVKKVAIDSPEAAELIGEDAKTLLEEEIELLDALRRNLTRIWSIRESFPLYFSVRG